MSILCDIYTIQFALTTICFFIQLYALFSTTWALFESHVELGVPDEHGHYGLWKICTSKLVPEEISEDDEYVASSQQTCEPIEILFKPAHNRMAIAIFAIVHSFALGVYLVIMLPKLLFIFFSSKKNESLLDENNAQTTQIPNNFWKKIFLWIFAKSDLEFNSELLKKQIRFRLYVISIAAASTSLAVMFAIVHRRPLRDSDPFQINQVSTLNYRVWRGSGFWAQLTTLVLDMLITSLIAIEVRVLFVLQNSLSHFITRTCSSEPATRLPDRNLSQSEEDKYEVQEVIVNPFSQSESFGTLLSSRHSGEREREIEETAISLHETRPKFIDSTFSSSSSSSLSLEEFPNHSLYINSIEVRRLKQQAALSELNHGSNLRTNSREHLSSHRASAEVGSSGSTPSTSASFSNPMFREDS